MEQRNRNVKIGSGLLRKVTWEDDGDIARSEEERMSVEKEIRDG